MDIHQYEGDNQDNNAHGRLDHCSSFPQELVDLIIDTISDGRQHPRQQTRALALATLRVCSIVASGWTGRAQRHIFEWAEIYNKTFLYRFA